MLLYLIIPSLMAGLLACDSGNNANTFGHPSSNNIEHVRDIPLPEGYKYVRGTDTSFADWLLHQRIRKDKTVYLYNGSRKSYQYAQYAILDIPIGNRDLLQCADVTMKLRGDHLFEKQDHDKIRYLATSGVSLSYSEWKKGIRWKQSGNELVKYTSHPDVSRKGFSAFMDLVYSYCGTYSLSKQLNRVVEVSQIQPGDVFVEGGFPGHAVMVMAVVKNSEQKINFLLAQGYMPAQDIHILINPNNLAFGPWFSADQLDPLVTPEWVFRGEHLKRW